MRHATLKQLRALAAVVRTGSVTAAARALHLSPPAVTLQMQLLADAAGLPLVERTGSGTLPTEAGRLVLAAAAKAEAALADCAAGLAALRGGERGTVRVGVVSTAKYFAPHALGAFARARPGVELRLEVGNRAEITDGLRRGELDVAVMGRTPGALRVEAGAIGPHPHVVAAPSDHPLAGRRGLPAEALAGETFLVREPGSGTRGLMEGFFAAAGISPATGMELGSNETIKQAVMAGLGVAFLSAHTIAAEVAAGRLAVLDVVGLPVVREWRVVRLAERAPTPAAAALAAFLLAQGHLYLPQTAAPAGGGL